MKRRSPVDFHRSRLAPRASLRRARRHRGSLERGFSLVEMMVALTVGLILLAGLTAIFVNNSRARDEINRANQQLENGRYAMQIVTDDLSNAGYYAEFDPTLLSAPTALPDVCATAVAALVAALPVPVQGVDNGATVPSCIQDVRANTDILVIRRASTCSSLPQDANCDAVVAGNPYFQASLCDGASELGSTNVANYYALDTNIANLTLHQRNCTTLAALHRYETHIYYVANDDNAGDGIPTLKLAELAGAGFTTSSLVEGIENLQLEYGLDTNGDGMPDVFTADPNSYNACTVTTTPTCVGNWQNAVVIKLHILSRNITQSPSMPDQKTYSLGLNFNGSANTAGPFGDRYKRHVYESTIKLFNTAGRRT